MSWQTCYQGKRVIVSTEWSQSKSGFSDILYLAQATHLHVRYTPKPKTSDVCISCSGTRNICNRCTESELVGNEGKCVFTISSDSVLFKPSNNFLTDRSKAVLVLFILFVICVSCHIVLSVPNSPFNPHVNTFGTFIIYLHDENFSSATVKGYRSAISTTLKQSK